jgi:predicted nuclease of predicted toxin-antitoxin system
MLLLIDENVPNSVAEFFRERSHDVRLVRDLFPGGTPDPVIAVAGDELGAIVVTWNHRDFKKLAARIPKDNVQRFRRLGRINFRCHEARGLHRLEQLIEWIEFEYAQVVKLRDHRLMIEIGETSFRIIR